MEFQGCVLGPSRTIPQCLIPKAPGSGAKGCEQRSSALMVCTLKAAREVMNCGFDHLLVVSSGASVCNLDTSRTLPQAETDPFVMLN